MRRILLPVLLAVFVLTGLSVVPYPGLQNDEVLFSAGVYDPGRTISVLSEGTLPLRCGGAVID